MTTKLHRLDCFVYALGALAMSRLKIDDCELQRVEAKNVGKETGEKEPPKMGRDISGAFAG